MAKASKTIYSFWAWSLLCLASGANAGTQALFPFRIGAQTFIYGQRAALPEGYYSSFLGLYDGGSIDTSEIDSARYSLLHVDDRSPAGDSAILLAGRIEPPGYGNDFLWVRKIDRQGKTVFDKTFRSTYWLDHVLVREKEGEIHVVCHASFVDDYEEPVPSGTWHFRLGRTGEVLDSSIIIPGDSIQIHGFDFHRDGYLLWGRLNTNPKYQSPETSDSKLMLFDRTWRKTLDKTYAFGPREEIDYVSSHDGRTVVFGQAWDDRDYHYLITARLDSAFDAAPEKRFPLPRYTPREVAFSETGSKVHSHILAFHSTFDFDLYRYDSTGFYDVAFDQDGAISTEIYYPVSKEYGTKNTPS